MKRRVHFNIFDIDYAYLLFMDLVSVPQEKSSALREVQIVPQTTINMNKSIVNRTCDMLNLSTLAVAS